MREKNVDRRTGQSDVLGRNWACKHLLALCSASRKARFTLALVQVTGRRHSDIESTLRRPGYAIHTLATGGFGRGMTFARLRSFRHC